MSRLETAWQLSFVAMLLAVVAAPNAGPAAAAWVPQAIPMAAAPGTAACCRRQARAVG